MEWHGLYIHWKQSIFSILKYSESSLRIQNIEQSNKWGWIILNITLNFTLKYRQPKSFIGEGNGTPLQYSCLENPMDGRAWWAAVHEVAKSRTRLSNFTFTFHFLALEKEMATHSSVLGWRIQGTGEPDGLLSMGSHRVGHDWSDLAVAAASHLYSLIIQFLKMFTILKQLLESLYLYFLFRITHIKESINLSMFSFKK